MIRVHLDGAHFPAGNPRDHDLEEIPWNIVPLFGGAVSIGLCLYETDAARWLAIQWLMFGVVVAVLLIWPLMGMSVSAGL